MAGNHSNVRRSIPATAPACLLASCVASNTAPSSRARASLSSQSRQASSSTQPVGPFGGNHWRSFVAAGILDAFVYFVDLLTIDGFRCVVPGPLLLLTDDGRVAGGERSRLIGTKSQRSARRRHRVLSAARRVDHDAAWRTLTADLPSTRSRRHRPRRRPEVPLSRLPLSTCRWHPYSSRHSATAVLWGVLAATTSV